MDLAYTIISVGLGLALNGLWICLDLASWSKWGWYVVAIAVAPIAFMKRKTTPNIVHRKPFLPRVMKLRASLTGPEMKYPRLANALLDVGMVVVILSSVVLIIATTFYWGLGPYMNGGFLGLFIGSVLVAGATQLSKVQRETVDQGRPPLRRIK